MTLDAMNAGWSSNLYGQNWSQNMSKKRKWLKLSEITLQFYFLTIPQKQSVLQKAHWKMAVPASLSGNQFRGLIEACKRARHVFVLSMNQVLW